MPSLSSVAHAVALLAPQTRSGPVAAQPDPGGAVFAPSVSAQPSTARTLAASTISNALLDIKPEPTGAAKAALDYLDSEDFKSSDPELKLILADVIRYGADTFNRKFDIERARDPDLTFRQVLGKTIERTILDNRALFAPGEIVLGMRDENGGVALVSIPAIGAKTTAQGDLSARMRSAKAADEAAAAESAKAGKPHAELPEFAEARQAFESWSRSWMIGLGFVKADPAVPGAGPASNP